MSNPATSQTESIFRLSDDVINKIAAGEIIERPQAVVRELVDNAIDAGAKKISIETLEGGTALVRVHDDGCGIASHEIGRAFERHATSKITSFEDLEKLATSGFRGEALASIASIAKITIRSRTSAQSTGSQAVLENGKMLSQKNCICPVGTTVSVGEIFYIIPARRKFLKTPRTELSKIRQWLIAIAPAFPTVQFVLSNDQKEELFFPPVADFSARARPYFDGNVAEVNFSAGTANVRAILAHPLHASSKEFDGLSLIVNGHSVFDKVIVRAIKDAYGIMLKPYEKLTGLMSVTLPPEAIDINVHPQKSEIRLKDSQAVYLLIRRSVEHSLRSFSSIETERPESVDTSGYIFTGGQGAEVRENSPRLSAPSFETRLNYQASQNTSALPFFQSRQDPLPLSSVAISQTAERLIFGNLLFVGQLFDCFLLFEKNDLQAVLVDMHAAHERIRYNTIRAELLEKQLVSQALILPVTIHLSAEQFEVATAAKPVLMRCGYEYELQGENVEITAIPSVIVQRDIEVFFKRLLKEELLSDRAPQAMERLLDRMAATLACHSSIRSGKVLSKEEVSLLCHALDVAESQALCPHGRPIATTIARAELDRWFGR